jgi:hypothetical protein
MEVSSCWYVERGHLIVHDGIGRDRNTLRPNRTTSRLSRLIVIGHTGSSRSK